MKAQVHITPHIHVVESSEQNTLDDKEMNDLDSDDDTHIPGGNVTRY